MRQHAEDERQTTEIEAMRKALRTNEDHAMFARILIPVLGVTLIVLVWIAIFI